MKLKFRFKNRKIKFREADYIEKHYIKDGKAVIPIHLNNINELYMKHDQIRHLRSLRLLLSQNNAPLGFLLAAGCPLSVRVSGNPLLPDMAGLTKVINNAHATDEATTPYKRLIEELGKAGKSVSNLEDVLTYVRTMKEVSSGGGVVRGFTEEELNNLEIEICKTISDAVTKDLPDGDNSYRRLARWVSSIDRSIPVELFTTNYDLLLEQALEEQNVPFFDGFSGSRYPFFDVHSVEGNELPSYWVRLWKLHGSVNWKTTQGGVCRVSKGVEGSPELIYPSKLKYDQSRKMPFLAMSDRLTNFLLKPHSVLFICGYSFGDEHINIMTKTALSQGVTLFNHYMIAGGTNWADLACDEVYTSYEFCAPIDEFGILPKIFAFMF